MCLERQRMEAEALVHIFGEAEVTAMGLDEADDTSSRPRRIQIRLPVMEEHDVGEGSTLEVSLLLPVDYPEKKPCSASVSCADLSREGVSSLQRAVDTFIEDTFNEDEECLFQVLTQARESARDLLESYQLRSRAAEKATSSSTCLPSHGALIQIDHMNDSAGYTGLLSSWAGSLSLQGDLLLRVSPGSKRATDIALVLQGSEDNIKMFLKRLRTEYVDVNSRGQKCKERQSDVLCSFDPDISNDSTGLVSFSIHSYSETQELHDELAKLHVLGHWLEHVK